jgi:hypothetical protein
MRSWSFDKDDSLLHERTVISAKTCLAGAINVTASVTVDRCTHHPRPPPSSVLLAANGALRPALSYASSIARCMAVVDVYRLLLPQLKQYRRRPLPALGCQRSNADPHGCQGPWPVRWVMVVPTKQHARKQAEMGCHFIHSGQAASFIELVAKGLETRQSGGDGAEARRSLPTPHVDSRRQAAAAAGPSKGPGRILEGRLDLRRAGGRWGRR